MNAMHLCATHCVPSDRKNQINRAQSRVNSGRADAKDGADVDKEVSDSAESGSVHATSIERTAVKLFCDAAGAVAVGIGSEAESVLATQQQSFIRPEQHEDFFCALESEVN